MEPELQYCEPPKYDAESVPGQILRDCYEAIQSHNPRLASRLIDYAHYAQVDLDDHIFVYKVSTNLRFKNFLMRNMYLKIAGDIVKLIGSSFLPEIPRPCIKNGSGFRVQKR